MPEDGVGREDPRDDAVELLGGLQIVAEGLLDDGAAPAAVVRIQARRRDPAQDGREQLRRDRQVEGVVAVGAPFDRHPVHGLAQPPVGVGIVVLSVDDPQAGHDLFQARLGHGGLRARPHGGLDSVCEAVVHPARHAEDGEGGRQEPPIRQIVEGRKDLPAGEVSGDAEEHDAARPGYALESGIGDCPQGVNGHAVAP